MMGWKALGGLTEFCPALERIIFFDSKLFLKMILLKH